jgi:hypothetical protein
MMGLALLFWNFPENIYLDLRVCTKSKMEIAYRTQNSTFTYILPFDSPKHYPYYVPPFLRT